MNLQVRATHQTAERSMEERIVIKTKKAMKFKSKTKMMLIDCFDVHGIVRAESLPQGQINNQNVYENILQRLIKSAREKRTVGNQFMAASSF